MMNLNIYIFLIETGNKYMQVTDRLYQYTPS